MRPGRVAVFGAAGAFGFLGACASGATNPSTGSQSASGSVSGSAVGSAVGGSGGTAVGGSGGGSGGTAHFDYAPNGGTGGMETCAAAEVKGKKAPVDIIFAVDTSGSMANEIAQVKANINGSFAAVLGQGDLDYRVTMIATKGTSAFAVCVAPPLGGPNCGSNLPLYRAVSQTVGSTNPLSLILSTYDSANAVLNWQSALRYDAIKVFVVITDDNATTAAQAFDTALLAKEPLGIFGTSLKRNYVFYGLIGIDKNDSTKKCSDAVNIGSVYQSLVTLTNGAQFSECEADYSPAFSAIAKNVLAKLSCHYAVPKNGPNGKAIDPKKVAVKLIDGMNQATPFANVKDAASCAGLEWYYDDNQNPGSLTLCPAACSSVETQLGGEVRIDVGCLEG